MRILSVIDSVSLYGKERANLQVAHVLNKHGYEVKLLINKLADQSIREEVIPFDILELPFPRNIRGKFRLIKFIKAYLETIVRFGLLLKKESPEYLLIPTEIAIAYLYFPLICFKTKVVFRCGDSPIIMRKNGILAKIYGWLWRFFYVRRIDKLVCNAKFIYRQIIDSGRKKNNNDCIIYNYPPIRTNSNDNIVYPNCSSCLRIGFLGRIVSEKGVYELMQSVIMANKEGLKVVAYIGGDVNLDKDYAEKLYGLMKENNVGQECFFFIGNVKDLKKFYENIDLIVIPSIYEEPMANVVTEAKHYSKPSVIFNLGGMPEIIEHKKTGYICKEVSPGSLKEAYLYYYNNKEEIKRQGNNAYNSIKDLGLDLNNFEKHWLNVFN